MESAVKSTVDVPKRGIADIRTACIAVVWFRDSADPAYRQHIMDTVRAQSGVVSVERSTSKAHLLLVHYDRLQTQASAVVNGIRQLGYDAALVGC